MCPSRISLRALLAACGLLAVGLATGAWPAAARATPVVSLHAAFAPERLGRPTTVDFRVRIAPTTELVPPPLIEADVRYPAGLDVSLSGLGIEACSVQTLELAGPQGCPADSIMGEGHAIAEFPVHHEVVRETAQIAIVRTDEREGHLAMLLYVYDEPAVSAQLVLTSQLIPDAPPYGGTLQIQVPLVATLPEAPDLAVAEIQLVLGPSGLVYYERVHGKRISYEPARIKLPGRCPRGGFPFAIELGFLGGAHASARTVVACPR